MCFIRRHIRYSCVYMLCMRHTLGGNSALQCIKLGDGLEIHDGIIFNFYPGLSCMYIPCTEFQLCHVWICSGHHDTTVHFSWVKCPVRDPNKCNSLLTLQNLKKRKQQHGLAEMHSTEYVILHKILLEGALVQLIVHLVDLK